jgi:hypothetical protein
MQAEHGRGLMIVQLATDPGAWNIIWWSPVLVVCVVAVLWVATALPLRREAHDARTDTAPPGGAAALTAHD